MWSFMWSMCIRFGFVGVFFLFFILENIIIKVEYIKCCYGGNVCYYLFYNRIELEVGS